MKRYLLLILLLIMFIPCIVNAEECDTSKVNISSITLDQANNTDELEDATAEDKNINLNLGMSNVGDNIRYRIIITNDSNDDYVLDKNSVSISSDYVDYSIESSDNSNIVKAKTSKAVYLNVQYKNPVPTDAYENGKFNDKVTMKVNLSSEEKITNPNTGVVYIIFLSFIIFLMAVSYLMFKNKRRKSAFFILGLLLIPISVHALCRCDININSNIEIDQPAECISFEENSWEDISENIKNNNTSCYHVGDTREIDMGDLGTHTLRIANMSTPEECSQDGFSQTACGFVVEFADVITTHRMNPFEQNANVNGDGNKGGWEYSEIRQYVNNDIYNSLPSNLKNVIIDTFAVSGYGAKDSENFLTTDKLYYFSKVEVDGLVYTQYTDSSFSRKLDFYNDYNTNHSLAIKKFGDNPYHWCFRTAAKMNVSPQYYDIFYGIRPSDGWVETYGACDGVSPAFRIG